MSEALETTFRVLRETKNEAAVPVLIPALDSPYESIRKRAAAAILARRSPAGHREVIRRLHRLDQRGLSLVGQHPHRMTHALRDAVLSADPQFCDNGCRAAIWLREYDLVPALLTAVEDAANPNADLAGSTLLQLVGLLYGELASPEERRRWRDPQLVRRRVVGALEQSVCRFGRHKRREVVEALAMLAERDNALLRQILSDPHHAAFVTLLDILASAQAGGVIRLLLGFLDDPHAPSVVLSVLARRTDVTLVRYLLKKIGREPSKVVRQNLKRISSIGWIGQRVELLDDLDDAEQHAVVRLVMDAGIPREQAFAAVRHVLLRGKPAGRRAAAEALEAFHGVAANELALQALADDDPEVQAKILVQLRRRGIPGALPKLVERLDSPHEVVRAAVRQSLSEFTFHRYLAAFDMLEDEVRRSTGRLVKRIDPETIPLLREEITSRVRSRRLRGLAIAEAMEAVDELEDVILEQLEDDDHMIRAQAAAALGRGSSLESYEALNRTLADRSPAVQEAARNSLRRREKPPILDAGPQASPPAQQHGGGL